MHTESQADRLVGAGVLGQPVELHYGRLRRRRKSFRVRVGCSHASGDRVGGGGGPRLSGGATQGHHTRLHRPAGRALHRSGQRWDRE